MAIRRLPEKGSEEHKALLLRKAELEEELAQLDLSEPKDMMSVAYDKWADCHEIKEDELDDILDILDALEDE